MVDSGHVQRFIGRPCPEWREYGMEIWMQTMGREAAHTCAAADGDQILRNSDLDAIMEAGERFLSFWNGDPRSPKPCHWCNGCCADDASFREAAFAVGCQFSIVCIGSSVRVPSKNRWGTVGAALGQTLAGMLFNDTLPQVAGIAFPHWASPDSPMEDNDGFRLFNRRKTWRMTRTLACPMYKENMAFLSWLLVPIEHALQAAQRLSDSPNPLQNLLTGRDPIKCAIQEYERMTSVPLAESYFRVLHWYYPEHTQEQSLATKIMCVAGQLWWRWLPYRSWSLTFVGFVASCPHDRAQATAAALYGARDCCLDADFSRKARELFESKDCMLQDDEFIDLVRRWLRHSKVDNMNCERLLARFRKAADSPAGGRAPYRRGRREQRFPVSAIS